MTVRPRVLSGHKQIGKRFVTPFNQIELVTETRYVERIMPELLWMDMINNLHGYRRGIDLTMAFCSQVRSAIGADEFINFTVASKFSAVSVENRVRVLDTLSASGILSDLSSALAPLIRNYPSFPMTWLFGAAEDDLQSDAVGADLEQVSVSVKRIIDKYTYPASIVQANVLVFRSMSGTLHYAEHVPVPDFNAMAENPDSEPGQRAATQARIGAMMDIVRDEDDAWPRSFWNDNYRLSKCSFLGDEE